MRKHEILLAQSEVNPYHPMILQRALEERGYQVTTALGSGPGIELLGRKNFDLVITDLSVVLEKAKEINPETMAILMLTTEGRFMLTVHSIRSAADDCVFIPFELGELEVRVANCLEKMELKKRNIHNPLNEKMEDLSKVLSYDIRGSLISVKGALELLCHGYYGNMDEGVMNGLKEVLSKTIGLIETTEECLDETLSGNGHLKVENRSPAWVFGTAYGQPGSGGSFGIKKYPLLIDPRFDGRSNRRIGDCFLSK